MTKNDIVRVSLYFGDEFARTTKLKDPEVVDVDDLKEWAKDTGFKDDERLINIKIQDLKVFKGKAVLKGKAKSTRDGKELDDADPVPSSYVVIKAPGRVWVSLYIGNKCQGTKELFAGDLMNVNKLKEWAKRAFTKLNETDQDDLKVFTGTLDDDDQVKKMERAATLKEMTKLSKCGCEYFVIEAPGLELMERQAKRRRLGISTDVDLTATSEDYKAYETVGETLAMDSRIEKFLELLNVVKSSTTTPKPFVIVDGPSGIGKTQLPFALKAKLKTENASEWIVRHVLAAAHSSELIQPVYDTIWKQTSSFWSCVCDDTTIFRSEKLPVCGALQEFSNKTFLTIEFLARLFGVELHPNDSKISTLADTLKDKTCVLFIDEVPAEPSRQKHVMFARNVCRLVGIVTVLMGTDACAANMVGNATMSRGGEGKLEWTYLFTNLPPSNEQALCATLKGAKAWLESTHELVPFVKQQLATARPLFAHYMLETVSADTCPDTLDQLLDVIAKRIALKKCKFWGDHSAQLCMFDTVRLHKDIPLKKSETMVSKMIVQHYAFLRNPKHDSYLQLFLDDRGLFYVVNDDKEKLFKPACYFDSSEALLFLTLAGTQNFRPFFELKELSKPVPVFKARFTKTIVNTADDDNPGITENSGAQLEAIAAIAMCVASRRQGVQGSEFWDFLCNVVTELQEHRFRQFEWEGSESLPSVEMGKIPVLNTPNRKWPAPVPGALLGTLVRPKNADRIDIVISSATERLIAVECKNHETKLKLKVMKAVLKRVTTPVHIVFCNEMQESYFQAKHRAKKFWATCDRHMTLLKVQKTAKNKLQLVEVTVENPQPTNQQQNGKKSIVIFLVLSELQR